MIWYYVVYVAVYVIRFCVLCYVWCGVSKRDLYIMLQTYYLILLVFFSIIYILHMVVS